MPRFYFDVRAGAECISDPEGLELDTLEIAEHEAMRTALALGRDWLPRAREIRVDVKDEQRRPLVSLTVALTIERAGRTARARTGHGSGGG